MDILKFIVENQSILPDVTALLADHNRLIRELALWVSQGNAGKGEAREAILGIYAEEVQSKINWAYQTAKEVRTVFGTFESPFRMIKLKAYCPKKKRKKFDTRAFIRPQQSD